METYYTNSTDYLGGAVLDWEFSMHNIYFQKKYVNIPSANLK